jgi:hypothetical protein
VTRVRQLAATVIAVVAALLVPSIGMAGGAFERIVGVGAGGAWSAIELDQTGPRSEAVLEGVAVNVPTGGYVRIYPMIGDLPAVPGRLYVREHVLCLYWHEPASNCSRLSPAGVRLLKPFTRLPPRHGQPTTIIEVRYHSRTLRYANGNIFAALELALERPAKAKPSVPADAVMLTVRWSGPNRAQLPRQLYLTASGVYSGKQLFPLSHGPWCYLAENLPGASAALIEATTRLCH